MKNRYTLHKKNRSRRSSILKILLVPVFIALSYISVMIGVYMGNIVYAKESHIISKADTQGFKDTLNFSFPIIDLVYNSGNISVSLSGEFKELVNEIFSFNIDYPVTILTAQSPIFYDYYTNFYTKTGENQGDLAVVPGDEKAKGPKENLDGNADGKFRQAVSSIAFEQEDIEDKEESKIISHDNVKIQNYTSYDIDVEELLNRDLSFNFSGKGPEVLIYHTHTSESYILKSEDIGKKDVASYNRDARYNVMKVGDELAKNLKKYGINVMHNGTVHDSDFDASYAASLKTLQKYKKSYPSIQIMFDIHRDALGKDEKLRLVKEIDGKKAAQIMFVVGTEGNGLPHPNWEDNLSFALKLQYELNKKYPGLARPVWISKNRYNQHITPGTLIIEVGANGNLLSEALESTKYLAEAVHEVIKDK
jgi:stage II sporulation protein P